MSKQNNRDEDIGEHPLTDAEDNNAVARERYWIVVESIRLLLNKLPHGKSVIDAFARFHLIQMEKAEIEIAQLKMMIEIMRMPEEERKKCIAALKKQAESKQEGAE